MSPEILQHAERRLAAHIQALFERDRDSIVDQVIELYLRAQAEQKLAKFNPYHDERGRFASGDGQADAAATSMDTEPPTAKFLLDHWVHLGSQYEQLRSSETFADQVRTLPQVTATMYRGAVMTSEEVANIKVGEAFVFDRNSSATRNAEYGEKIAAQFANKPFDTKDYGGADQAVIMKLEGATGADLVAMKVSWQGLGETIIPMGSKFIVESMERGVRYDLETTKGKATVIATRLTFKAQ